MLSIGLLGELQLTRAGEALALPASKKTRALAGYLAAEQRPHLRERLCELLWEGPDDPRAGLRWSLAKLRPLLDEPGGPVRLLADRERVALLPEGAEIDWLEVRRAVAGGLEAVDVAVLRGAAARFRGELLDGLDLADCHRFHAWVTGERERARVLRLGILSTLAARLADRPEEALAFARERVAADPLSEAAHAEVVRLLARLGRGRDALRQYDACRRMLAEELGSRPSGLLEAARGEIGAGPPASAATVAPAAAPRPAPIDAASPGIPIAGRDAELALIERRLAAAEAGEASAGLLFLGEPGIGKSRVLDELAARVRARGGQVLRGRAFEAEMVRPYGPWIDALRSVTLDAADARVRGLAPLLPELGGAPAEGGDKGRLFDAVARLLGSLPEAGVTAVLLDDLQWFDEASAALLHFLARALAHSPVLLACAARPGELADNPAALRVVRSLSRDGRLTDVPLGPLGAEATARLVRAVAPDADTALAHAASEGNPLFALEVARAIDRGSSWHESLDALIQDRLAELDGGARDVLPWAAALGRAFDPDLLARVTGLPAAALLAALDELERRTILRGRGTPAGGAAYDFAHDLIRQAAYRGLSEPRRRLVHRHIARALAASDDDALAGEVAHHAAQAGDHELAARSCILGGERCVRLFAREEAVALAERGRQSLAGLPDELRVRLHVGLLKVHVIACWGELRSLALDDELAAVEAEAAAVGLRAEVRIASWLLSCIHLQGGDFARTARDAIRGAEAGRDADPATAVESLANGGHCLALIGREMGRAAAMLREAQQLAARTPAPPHPDIDAGLGLLRHFEGRLDEARPLLLRSLASVRRTKDHWRACVCLSRLVMIDLEQGRSEDAIARCRDLHEVAARMRESSEGPLARALEALARVRAAPGAEEIKALEVALAELRRVDNKAALAYVQTFAAGLDLERGDHAAARRRAEEACRAAEAVDQPSEIAAARALLGRIDLLDGDRAAGRRRVEPVLPQVGLPDLLSARATAALTEAARALGLPVPTLAPTLAPTPPA